MRKYLLWLPLMFLLLSACGGKATPTLPSAEEAGTALAGLPLPHSEETLIAEIPQAEASLTPEAPLTTVETSPDALQAPIYTDIAQTEAVIPTLTPPPAEIQQAPPPTEMLPAQAGSTEQSQELSAPPVQEEPPSNEVIIESQASPAPSSRLGRFIPPGLICLIGILFLGMGLYMALSSQPTGQGTKITVLNIAEMTPGSGLVELSGVITQVPQPLDKNVDAPLAVLRLVVEENQPQVGWSVVMDRVEAREFALEDGTGTVWITPDKLDLSLLGEGSFASIKQAEEALKILGLQSSSAWGRGLRYRIWELRRGQSLIASGNVQQALKLKGTAAQPVALAHTAISTQAPAVEESGISGVNLLLVLVIAVGGAAFLGGLAWLLWALMQ